ncbi:MAG: hypothetical protein ACTS3F_00895 [Phycisphaerales bacterium]
MSHGLAKPSTRLRAVLTSAPVARAAWIALLAIHAPPLLATTTTLINEPSLIAAGKLLALLLTIALFVYKALGRRILPRCKTWHAAAAFAALTGIAHAGVIPQHATDLIDDTIPTTIVLATTATAIASQRRRIARGADKLIDRLRRWIASTIPTAPSIAREALSPIPIPVGIRALQPALAGRSISRRGPPARR